MAELQQIFDDMAANAFTVERLVDPRRSRG